MLTIFLIVSFNCFTQFGLQSRNDNIPKVFTLFKDYQNIILKLEFAGLIEGIFETLYDSNVVSEEGFESWVSVDDPLEREGKAVALKMITSFLTWLKEADPESDQEADA